MILSSRTQQQQQVKYPGRAGVCKAARWEGLSTIFRPLRVDKASRDRHKSESSAELVDPKEDSRSFRRVVYNFERWTKHRSTQRYFKNILTTTDSRVISDLGGPVMTLTAFCVALGFYETAIETGILPAWLPRFLLSNPQPQNLTSFALSLLLVFRTNSSYGRFDEARKMWGGILNHSRNIMNQAVTTFPKSDKTSALALGRWTVAFSYALAGAMQEDFDANKDASKLLLPQEVDVFELAENKPLKCLHMMAELMVQADLTPLQRQMIQQELTFFQDALGGCERILKTPIPLSYTRNTCRFLIIWLFALPLGLWEQCRWSMVPITAIVALLLLPIEEIWVQTEEPFGLLPLDAICERIRIDVRATLEGAGGIRNFVAELRSSSEPCSIAQSFGSHGVTTPVRPGPAHQRSTGSRPSPLR